MTLTLFIAILHKPNRSVPLEMDKSRAAQVESLVGRVPWEAKQSGEYCMCSSTGEKSVDSRSVLAFCSNVTGSFYVHCIVQTLKFGADSSFIKGINK